MRTRCCDSVALGSLDTNCELPEGHEGEHEESITSPTGERATITWRKP